MENAIVMVRLDKCLADMKVGTRSEVKKQIRKGFVTVNNNTTKAPDHKVLEGDCIKVLGREYIYQQYVYYMLNKPAGVVSATRDNHDDTVIDLLGDLGIKDIFPVGRLDKDTEGLLLLTNNGNLAHDLLSPKKHVDKVYYAKIEGKVTEEDIRIFSEGVTIGEEEITMPAVLHILDSGDISEVEITIREGKFHQIKRMFLAVDKEVLYLKRLRMGSLVLDESLELGEFRPLTEEELLELC